MKKLMKALVILLVMVGCQPQASGPERYTTNAPEIDMAKATMNAYFAGDWGTMRAAYADTAKIYHNSMEPMTSDAVIEGNQSSLSAVSSYQLGDETFWERIIDDEGRTWVYFWGEWKGVHAATNKELSVPFHVAWHYVDGKVVEEYGLWDNAPMIMAEQEAAAAAEAEVAEEM